MKPWQADVVATAEDFLWEQKEPVGFDKVARAILPEDDYWQGQVNSRRRVEKDPAICTYAGYTLRKAVTLDQELRRGLGFEQILAKYQVQLVGHVARPVRIWYDKMGWPKPPEATVEVLSKWIEGVGFENFEFLVQELLHGRAIVADAWADNHGRYKKYGADGSGYTCGRLEAGDLYGLSESQQWQSGVRVLLECKDWKANVPLSVVEQVRKYMKRERNETRRRCVGLIATTREFAGETLRVLEGDEDLFGVDTPGLARLMLRWHRGVLPGGDLDPAYFRRFLTQFR